MRRASRASRTSWALRLAWGAARALSCALVVAPCTPAFAAGRAALHEAAARGDVAALESLLEGGADVDARDEHDVSALVLAAAAGKPEAVTVLLDHEADPDAEALVRAELVLGRQVAQDTVSWLHATPLILATQRGDARTASLLLEHGADPNFATAEGVTALLRAAFEGRVKLVRLLLDGGAEADTAESVFSELLLAEGMGEDLGIEFGAEIELRPLHAAAHAGHPVAVAALLEHGADADTRINGALSPLWLAARRGQLQAAKRLLDGEAEVALPDDSGVTPLHAAISEGRGSVAALLIAHGADVDAADDVGATPLMAAIESNDTRTARLLLERGADVRVRTSDGSSLLHVAALHGHRPAIELLLARGLDVDLKSADGSTPLRVAERAGHDETVALLRERGARPADPTPQQRR